ncbi:hypothetical protein PR048_000177 [Dryococelus australis]|uniref:C2H2-type domain-containing protein n=1 Tax=Dryococelus australis TaxID=614101 RepID=A0ABQ9IDX8_9NEOP|nr:hypothetical protein PR048_000177 [Dryococelus australis]
MLADCVSQAMQAYSQGPEGDRLVFCCPRCFKSYKFKTSLYRHIKFECGKDPRFQCPRCPYMTKQKAPMKRHIITIHAGLTMFE